MPTYERMVVFRLGRIRTPQGPGMVLLLPFIDSFQRVDLRTRAFSVPPCKVRGFLALVDRGSGGLCWVYWPVSSH